MVWELAEERTGDDELQAGAQDLLDREERREAARRYLRGKRPLEVLGIGWLPAPGYERALTIWPRFAADHEQSPYAIYRARLESVLRDVSDKRIAEQVGLVEIAIDDYRAACPARRCDPDTPDTPANYATDLAECGLMTPWPPARNQPRWCASGRKYKKRCGGTNDSGPASRTERESTLVRVRLLDRPYHVLSDELARPEEMWRCWAPCPPNERPQSRISSIARAGFEHLSPTAYRFVEVRELPEKGGQGR